MARAPSVRFASILALLVLVLFPKAAAAQSCAMAPGDAAWIAGAVRAWETVRAADLKLAAVEPPTIVTFDAACAYIAPPARPLRWAASPHGKTVTLPDGQEIPAGVISFAASFGVRPKGFFVMSLPSVWRAGGVTSALGLETLMEAVFVHEIMHTRQFYFADPRLAELTKRYGLPDDISDDSLQDHFKADPAYVADYQAERDLLYAAAVATSQAQAQALAAQALERMRARRARWFTGAEAKWLPLDDLFLVMEGLGQWAGYRWLVGDKGRGLDPGATLTEFRRGGRFWTQDEGLALMLVVDRLRPGWQKAAFAAEPALAEALLAQAVEGAGAKSRP
jgi:hypothetical protein